MATDFKSLHSLVRSPGRRAILQEAEMTAVVGREVICAVQVVIGVDTHQDEHVAVAIDQQGLRQKFARGRRGLVGTPVTATPPAPLRMALKPR